MFGILIAVPPPPLTPNTQLLVGINFMAPKGTRVAHTPPSHAGADAIGCLEICVQQQLMFTADNSGCLQTWDISGFVEHVHDLKPSHFVIVHTFRCHSSAITSLQYDDSLMLLLLRCC